MNITITGPRSVGKTTISKGVAKKLKLKYISSDEIGEKAFKKYGGLDKAIKSGVARKLLKKNPYSLIRNVYEKNNFVFDLSGGSISSRKYPEASEKVRKIAKENSVVIGLLPSKSVKESVNFLFDRERLRKHFKGEEKKELFNKTKEDYKKYPPLFKELCNVIVYVKDKTSEEIVTEIQRKIGSRNG